MDWQITNGTRTTTSKNTKRNTAKPSTSPREQHRNKVKQSPIFPTILSNQKLDINRISGLSPRHPVRTKEVEPPLKLLQETQYNFLTPKCWKFTSNHQLPLHHEMRQNWPRPRRAEGVSPRGAMTDKQQRSRPVFTHFAPRLSGGGHILMDLPQTWEGELRPKISTFPFPLRVFASHQGLPMTPRNASIFPSQSQNIFTSLSTSKF